MPEKNILWFHLRNSGNFLTLLILQFQYLRNWIYLQAHKKKIEGTPKEDTPISGKEDEAGCDKKDAKAEAEKAAKAKKKKARKAANAGKKGNDGSFWWNNAVYASW